MISGESPPLLEINNLKTYFYTDDGVVKAVDGINIELFTGEVLGLVGESGCGKSVTSLSIMRLIREPGRIIEGEILFEDRDLLKLSDKKMTDIRGNRISMIFQQPLSSLDPMFTIGSQVSEVFQVHKGMNKKQSWINATELLQLVGIADAERKAHSYPHEISGGQAQRVMIAIALALKPQLLIADEPTTALDVTIQAQILDLLRDLRNQLNTSVILISHDLGVIAETADRVAVMYAGRIVEKADVSNLFSNPLHPYTIGLMDSVPVLGEVKDKLNVIEGNVPNLIDLPKGCRFAPRCKARIENELERCNREEPELLNINNNHFVRCWLFDEEKKQ